jgi:UDP-2,3-diacylglucosamine pyrophosphatase LpxH
MLKLIKHSFGREVKELEIYPLNDLHIGDSKTDLELFNNFVKFILSDENRYIICCGDLMNNAIKSSVSNVYGETMSPAEQKKYLVKVLAPLKDRILGITTGNHEGRSKKETDTDITEDIATMLGLSHLYNEEGLFIKIAVGTCGNNGKAQQNYVIHAMHGFGGGKFTGSSMNNLENYGIQYEGVDVFVMGHVHGKISSRGSKVIVDTRHDRIVQKDVLYVISGAWQNYGGYGMKMMLRAKPKGESKIVLSGTEKKMLSVV